VARERFQAQRLDHSIDVIGHVAMMNRRQACHQAENAVCRQPRLGFGSPAVTSGRD
jgi:hypothetical protein